MNGLVSEGQQALASKFEHDLLHHFFADSTAPDVIHEVIPTLVPTCIQTIGDFAQLFEHLFVGKSCLAVLPGELFKDEGELVEQTAGKHR